MTMDILIKNLTSAKLAQQATGHNGQRKEMHAS